MPEWNHVGGKNSNDVKVYALSTCEHCKKTKEMLEEMNIAYDYIFVDLLEEDEFETLYSEVKKYNPRGSFPTILIDQKEVIVGFRAEQIKKALGIDN